MLPPRRPKILPTSALASVVWLPKTVVVWKVRAIPTWQI